MIILSLLLAGFKVTQIEDLSVKTQVHTTFLREGKNEFSSLHNTLGLGCIDCRSESFIIFICEICLLLYSISASRFLCGHIIIYIFLSFQLGESDQKKNFSKFYGKSRCLILITFPSHLKNLCSIILRFWLERLNCGFFHSFHSK